MLIESVYAPNRRVISIAQRPSARAILLRQLEHEIWMNGKMVKLNVCKVDLFNEPGNKDLYH